MGFWIPKRHHCWSAPLFRDRAATAQTARQHRKGVEHGTSRVSTDLPLLGTLKGRVADLARMFGDSELDLVIYWMNLHRKIDVEIFP